MSLTVSVDVSNIAPYFGIGHNLSLICQPTSEDMKLYFIIIIIIINIINTHSHTHTHIVVVNIP